MRAVAIVLVIVYHIWFRKVSGGVDVFLMLSGFLITLSLANEFERRGRIKFAAFYSRIIRRILPAALLVVIGVVVATLLFIPQVRWLDTLKHAVASAFYYQNWQLAHDSVDYLAAQNAASPLQHYWSLAIQGQFYLIWPILLVVVAVVAGWMSIRPKVAAAIMCAIVTAASLAYSVHITFTDPPYAYFDTFSRLWEFGVGGLLGFAIPLLRLNRVTKVLIGWTGLIALVTCGMLFRGDEFPGYVALWPTLAAGMMIAAKSSGSSVGVDRLLRTTALRHIGDISYALYLWHWPVLICYLSVTERTVPSVKGALAIVAVSVILAVATKRLVEDPLHALTFGQRKIASGFAIGAVCLATTLAATGAAYGVMDSQRGEGPLDPDKYPGAAHLATGGALPDAPYRPTALESKDDRPALYPLECFQKYQRADVKSCEFGSANPELTIALVGGSHSAHWFPALEELAEQNRWRIVTMIKSSCPLTTDMVIYNKKPYTACADWNTNVIQELAALQPDIVFAPSTRGDSGDDTPAGYVEQWRALDDLGLDVVAIRDTPWHHGDVPECVEVNGADAEECAGSRAGYGLDRPAKVVSRTDIPDNVTFIDLSDYLCDEKSCPGVIGNVLVYHDAHHLTATYARSMAPYVGEAMSGVTRDLGGK